MGKSKFNDEQLETIKQLYLDGKSIRHISVEMNSAYSTISRIIKNMGIFQYKTKRWTHEEIQYLKDNYAMTEWDTILVTLSRWTKSEIIGKASDLHLKREIYFWSKQQIAILTQACNDNKSTNEIVDLLDKHFSEEAINTKIYKLGLSRREWWSDEENELLSQIYGTQTLDEICELFPNRGRKAIISHAASLNLVNKIVWKPDEIAFIKSHYKDMNDEAISKCLGHPTSSVQMKRLQIGLPRITFENKYTNVNDFLRRNNRRWRQLSAKHCNNQCVITGTEYSDIHHLYGMNLIVSEVMQDLGYEDDIEIESLDRSDLEDILNHFFDVQNKYPLGVCLSKDIHTLFHQEYGYGNNTPEQFDEFLEKHNYKIA